MKPMPTSITADWMAQQWRNQKRLLSNGTQTGPRIGMQKGL
jgi:hypothetical protein